MLEAATKVWRIDHGLRFSFLAALALGLVFVVAACGNSASDEITGATDLGVEASTQSVISAEITTKSSVPNPGRKIGGDVGNLAPELGGINAWINGAHLSPRLWLPPLFLPLGLLPTVPALMVQISRPRLNHRTATRCKIDRRRGALDFLLLVCAALLHGG